MNAPSLVQPRHVLHVFSVACATVLLAACTAAQVRMPAGFAGHAVAHDVTGHSPRRFNQPVRFGPYSALQMREGSTFSWGFPVARIDVGRTAKPYDFTLVARDLPPVEVQCRLRTWTAASGRASRRMEIDLTALAGPMMVCGMRMDGTPAAPLEMSRTGTRVAGRLVAPWGGEYAVRSLTGFDGSSWPGAEPTGYEISGAEGIVAVVDLLNAGRVHLDDRLEPDRRVYFAAASAALLLLDPELDA